MGTGRARRAAGGLLMAVAVALAAAGGAAPAMAASAPGLPSTLQLVGSDPLGARGLNAGLALADHCAYVGSRGQGPIAIVDITDPTHPRDAGTIPAKQLTTPRELRAIPGQKELIVLNFALDRGGANRIDLYRWTGDCTQPTHVGVYDFGGRPPHEFFLWVDPAAARTLLFVTMFSGGADDLQVLDVTDPSAPKLAGAWTPPLGMLHSMSVSADGKRAFLALWTGGLLIADVSPFTSGLPNPHLTLLTQVADRVLPLQNGNVHSAVQLPGRNVVIVTDERYPPACPYGPARLVDVSDSAHPRVVSELAVPENDQTTCASAPVGAYTSHNPTIIGDLALITWYSSGFQVFDVSDPAHPQRLAEFRPQAIQAGQRDPSLGVTATETWSYPIVRNGLIYIADINQGLFILRYSGVHQEQIAQTGFAEGNSNLTAGPPPTPTPKGGVGPALPTSGAHPSGAPVLVGRPTTGALSIAALIVLVLLAAAAGGYLLVRRSMSGSR